MTDHLEARVINAISETMTCDKCPCPCIAKSSSSIYNCAKQWGYILSQIDPKSDWKEVIDEVYAIWNREHQNYLFTNIYSVTHFPEGAVYTMSKGEKTHD